MSFIILQQLNGTFLMAYTSAPVAGCQKITYEIGANGITTGHVESPRCCLEVSNFVFNSYRLDYTIRPISGFTDSCSLTTINDGSMKLLAVIGSGSSLCLVVAKSIIMGLLSCAVQNFHYWPTFSKSKQVYLSN